MSSAVGTTTLLAPGPKSPRPLFYAFSLILAVVCSARKSGLRRNPLQWRWVNELGVHNAVDARELVEALLSGRITPHVWVWRTGWKTWLRASQVPDLVAAIPKGARLPPAAIEIDPAAVEPPPIPHYSFRESRFVRHTSTPLPPAAHPRQLVRRPPAPTLVDSQSVTSQTLRPPGAVPPPPRNYPSENLAIDVQRALDLATFASDGAAPSAQESSTVSQRPSIAPRLIPAPAPDFVIQSVMSGAEKEAREPGPAPAAPTSRPIARPPSLIRQRLLVIGIAVVAVATGSIVWLRTWVLKRDRQHAAAAAAAAAASASKHREPAFCHVVGNAARIAPNIVFNVPPFVETSADGRSLAVGFADNPVSAAGIIVDPVSLSVRYAFRKANSSKVASVVPQVSGGQLSFAVNLDSDPLKDARPVAGPAPFTFSHNVEGFVRQGPSLPTETIWPTDIDAVVTGARLATLDTTGHVVTYRQGGMNGSLWVGWLTPEGRSRTAPFAVPTSAKFIGQPSIAAGGASGLIAFAGRINEKEHWQVHLARVGTGSQQAFEHTFQTPAGGPGGDSIAPSVAALDPGRFLLQWSEGTAGHWQVRVQTLNEQLQPWGPALNTSPSELNAGQGTLWVRGSHAVSLFIVNVGRGAELWAASLDCPR